MDEQTTNKPSLPQPKRPSWVIVIPLALVLVLALGIGVGVGLSGGGDGDSSTGGSAASSAPQRIGYATEGVVATDPETLQDAVDEMYKEAQEPGVSLEYKDIAISNDGKNFRCYIGNSEKNAYDMFIAIYADAALTDELFLSELLRPGSRFEEITLEQTLSPGVHTAYIVYTQVVDEENSEDVMVQTIHAQVATTINLEVRSQ